jgi:hypothetical protein
VPLNAIFPHPLRNPKFAAGFDLRAVSLVNDSYDAALGP